MFSEMLKKMVKDVDDILKSDVFFLRKSEMQEQPPQNKTPNFNYSLMGSSGCGDFHHFTLNLH